MQKARMTELAETELAVLLLLHVPMHVPTADYWPGQLTFNALLRQWRGARRQGTRLRGTRQRFASGAIMQNAVLCLLLLMDV